MLSSHPYDCYLWGEAQAADGLTALLAKGPEPIVYAGDKNTVRSVDTPFLFALGSVSDTKPQGCALTPSRSNFGQKFYGPGAIDLAHRGLLDLRVAPFAPKRLQKGETLEGFISSTAVNEGGIVAAFISYGRAPPLVIGPAVYKDIFSEQITITTTTALAAFDGKVALDAATTDDLWLNSEKDYAILGLIPNISAATFGGILQISGLGGAWHGYVPGIPLNPLSGVTFNAGAPIAAASPIPFKGSALPSVSVFASSLGAITAAIVIAEL